jgi:hypothetical protein
MQPDKIVGSLLKWIVEGVVLKVWKWGYRTLSATAKQTKS